MAAEHVLARRELQQAAVVDHRDAVAEHVRLAQVVRHEDDRHIEVAAQAQQLAPQVAAQRLVERRERLVEQQRIDRARQRACERHALLLAA